LIVTGSLREIEEEAKPYCTAPTAVSFDGRSDVVTEVVAVIPVKSELEAVVKTVPAGMLTVEEPIVTVTG
jgi:hypothetical protein